jgi:hypothetical protein
VHRPAVERVRMAHHHGKAWLSLRVPFKRGFQRPVDPGDEKIFDFRSLPPAAKLLVCCNYEARLVALLEPGSRQSPRKVPSQSGSAVPRARDAERLRLSEGLRPD